MMAEETPAEMLMKTIAREAFAAEIEPLGSHEKRREMWDSMTEEEKLPHYRKTWNEMRRQGVREIVFEILEEPGKHFAHKDAPFLEDDQVSWVDRIMDVVDAAPPKPLSDVAS